MNNRIKLLIMILCALLTHGVWTQAQPIPLPRAESGWIETQKLTATNAVAEDTFGYSVAMSGDGNTLLVGTRGRNGGRGSASVFIRNGDSWTLQQELFDTEGRRGDQFGFAVALSHDGNTAMIGSSSANRVSLFTRNAAGWALTHTFSENTVVDDRYGSAIALSLDGSIALIGAYGQANGSGVVYSYRQSGGVWSSGERVLLPSQLAPLYSGFGYSMKVSGNNALISAINPARNDVVFAYQFNGTVWTYTQMLEGELDDPGAGNDRDDYFGWSIALDNSGTTALVGEWGADAGQTGGGAVYVYINTTGAWTLQQKIVLPNAQPYGSFGWSVDLNADGSKALIGAVGQNSNRGGAYVFGRNGSTWQAIEQLSASDGVSPDAFGWSVAMNDDATIGLIAARGDDLLRGSAYLFRENMPITVTATPPSENPQVTPTTDGSLNILTNGGFENRKPNGQLEGWRLKGGGKDKVRCNSAKSYNGGCAFRFKATSGKSVLRQKIKGSSLSSATGDVLRLTLYARSRNPLINAQVSIRAVYTDGTGPSQTFVFITQSNDYTTFNGSITLSSPAVKNIRVQIEYTGANDQLWIDDVVLTRG